MAALTIGRLAKKAGVHVESVRYYQRLGLLPVPEKPLCGFRRYDDETLRRLRFIKRAQRLGFTLKEISELLQMDRAACDKVRAMAEQKLAEVESKLEDLAHLKAILEATISDCRDNPAAGCCLLERLLAEKA